MVEFARYLAEVFRAPLAQFLLDAAAKATLLLIAAMVASALLRRSSAAVRHRVWCLTFAALLVLPALSAVLPKWRVAVLPYSSPLAPREESLSLAPQAEAGGAVNPVEIGEQSNVPARGGLPLAEREDYYTLARRADEPAARPLPKMALLWLLGMLLSLLPLVIGSLRTYLLRRQSRPIADESWRDLLNQLRQRLALSRRVQLYETDAALMPMTWGVLRPVIMLPRQAREWPDRLRRIVLLHELAHIERCDVGFQLLGRFVCAVYWFHPLAWYALRRLRIERELACDDSVVLTGERASDYAAELLQIARSYRPDYFAAAVAMAQRNNLEHRLHALFDRARSHLPLGTRAANLLLVGVATLVTITAAVRLAPRATADDVAQPPSAQLPPAPEKKAVDNADQIAVVKAAETKSDVVTLRGHVLLPDGKPAAGAGLYWVGFKAPPPRKPEDIAFEKRAAADEEGRFEFSLMEHDALLEKKVPRPLLAYLPGYGVDWVEIVQDEVPEDTVLRLVEDNPIRGRVTNTEGRRVAGAKVTVRIIAASQSGSLDEFLAAWKPNRGNARLGLERQCYAARLLPQLTTVTDREGRFELSGVGAERLASVNISAPGLVSEDLEIINRDRFDAEQFNEAARAGMLPQMRTARRSSGLTGPIFEHVAETEMVVRGIVFTGPDRKPVVRAIVGAQGNGLNNPISVQTDEMGHFELRGLPRSQNGGISVYAPKDSKLLFKSMKPDLAPGQTVVDVEIEMKEGVFVEGRVFDQATGRGVKSRVQFVPLPGNQYAEQPRPAVMQMAGNTTDDDGHFRMLVMPGIGVLTAQVQPGRQGDLSRPPPLGGIKPIPYRQASFSDEDSKRVTVAGDGDNRYFTDVYMGRFLRSLNAVKVIDLAPGSEPATCDLPLDPGKATTIAIEDEQGQPVTDAIVSGVADAGQMVFRSAEQNCTIYGLGADRPRQVCILHPERRLATSFTMTGDELGPVAVRLGAVASIVGRALDPDGEPLADALVQINYERRSASDLFFFVTRDQALKTDGDGRFRVENLLPRERLALSFRRGDKFFGGPRITDEKRQLQPGEKLELGEFTAKQLQ